MKQLAGILLAGGGLLVATACQQAPSQQAGPAPVDTQAAKQSPAERGKYLVDAIGGCDDCHTPKNMGPNGPEPDMSKRLSGHPETAKLSAPPKLSGGWMFTGSGDMTAWAGPWGISYTANLTPDASGLAAWNEEMFVKAMRTAKHMGQSRPILPPMPVQVFKNMTDDDLKAIFAFLKTLPPVANHVPDPVINEMPPAAAPAPKK